jgi:hypothetical protein
MNLLLRVRKHDATTGRFNVTRADTRRETFELTFAAPGFQAVERGYRLMVL